MIRIGGVSVAEMLVSIITPNYNGSKYIGEAIESVVAQTFHDWELIIVDDCSSDNSVEIISDYIKKDGRIKLYRTERCSGSPVEPRNVGIKKAQGRYIAFLDSDDVWLPGKLETQLKYFIDEKTAVVFSNYEKIAEDGGRNKRIVRSPPLVDYKKLLTGNCIGCLSAVYDTSRVGKVFLERFHHEDYILWLSILQKGYIARNTNTVEALYRVRFDSVSARKNRTLQWQWEIYRRYLHLPLLRSVYYFCFYLVNGFLKYTI